MAANAKVDYDYDNDVLYAYIGNKVKDSLQIENFVIDFSADGKIVAIEVLDASKNISKLSGLKISKNLLSNLENASIEISQGKEIVYIFLILPMLFEDRMDVRIPVMAPTPVIKVRA